jgi:hypothetical protein
MSVTKATPAVRKSPNTLSFHPKKTIEVHRLPFVGNEHTADRSFSFWDIPAKGGYTGGCMTGEAIAGIFLKHIRRTDSDFRTSLLGWMVFAWLERIAPGAVNRGNMEFDSLRGQMDGFMSVISKWLDDAVHRSGSDLDEIDRDELLRQANAGFSFDMDAFLQSLVQSSPGTAAGCSHASASK